MGTQVLGFELDSWSCWTRTRVLHIWTRLETCGLGLRDSAICAAEDSIQVHLTSNIKTLESETAIGPPLTRHGFLMYRYITSWPNIKMFHYCERCLVLELRNFCSLELGFGLEPQTPGLGSCPVRLGLDSRHAGLGLDSDTRKRGLVATQSLSTWIGYEFGPKSHHIRDHCRLPNCTIIKAKFYLNLLELICWWCITRIIWTKFYL